MSETESRERVLELANELSAAISRLEAVVNFKRSKERLTRNPDSFILYNDYKNLQRTIGNKMNRKEELTDEERSQFEELKKQFEEDELIAEFIKWEEEVAQIISEVNRIIASALEERT